MNFEVSELDDPSYFSIYFSFSRCTSMDNEFTIIALTNSLIFTYGCNHTYNNWYLMLLLLDIEHPLRSFSRRNILCGANQCVMDVLRVADLRANRWQILWIRDRTVLHRRQWIHTRRGHMHRQVALSGRTLLHALYRRFQMQFDLIANRIKFLQMFVETRRLLITGVDAFNCPIVGHAVVLQQLCGHFQCHLCNMIFSSN